MSFYHIFLNHIHVGIKHGLRVLLKTKAQGRGFEQPPRDLANVYAIKNLV